MTTGQQRRTQIFHTGARKYKILRIGDDFQSVRSVTVTMKQLSPPLEMLFDLGPNELRILFDSPGNEQLRYEGNSRSSDAIAFADHVERQDVIVRQVTTWTYRSGARCIGRGWISRVYPTTGTEFLDFCKQSKTVKITLLGKPRQSARFSGEEVMLICGRNWPTADSVENVRRSVRERKAYPLAELEIPGGGKSRGAQGQTRKPGSHKDNCGHD